MSALDGESSGMWSDRVWTAVKLEYDKSCACVRAGEGLMVESKAKTIASQAL